MEKKRDDFSQFFSAPVKSSTESMRQIDSLRDHSRTNEPLRPSLPGSRHASQSSGDVEQKSARTHTDEAEFLPARVLDEATESCFISALGKIFALICRQTESRSSDNRDRCAFYRVRHKTRCETNRKCVQKQQLKQTVQTIPSIPLSSGVN